MSGLESKVTYLHIPSDYGEYLGGLRWAADALEAADGTTVAVLDEVLQILEGAFAGPAAPPFAYVVTLLYAIKGPTGAVGVPAGWIWFRLREAYQAARGAEGRSRNTGLLIAELCRGLPGLGPPFPIRDVVALAHLRRRSPKSLEPVPSPPLAPDTLLASVGEVLQGYESADLVHWFRHGCGRVAAGEQLAEPVESLAQRLAQLVALARKNPRLAGAASLVPAFDAALTLPPRRRSRSEIPQGGYADVSTRGDPGRLLPSQLALDPDDFIRRFAENELLFFEREEPRAARTPDRVLLLDQGVRTWGSVRLGLAGAALALLAKAPKYGGATRLVTTGGDAIDWADTAAATIADVLQASDLSETPAAALRTVLGEPGPDVGRDIVLLTHPRALAERVVVEACRAKGPADRLFYLTLDAPGRAELGEWATAGPVAVRSFKVDLAAAEAVPAAAAPRPRPAVAHPTAWTGDVEPVPFPFRPGLIAEPILLGFSAEGDVCVAVSRSGIPHAIRTDGSPVEVLPRAFHGRAVLRKVEAVLGVANGVVLGGLLTTGPGASQTIIPEVESPAVFYVAAHYDFGTRRVRVHGFGRVTTGPTSWHAWGDLNCVVCRHWARPAEGETIDLDTCEIYVVGVAHTISRRPPIAWQRAEAGSPPHDLRQSDTAPGWPGLHQDGPALRVTGADPPWDTFTPLSDGEPILNRETIGPAQLAGSVLALGLFSRDRGHALLICRGPTGAVLSYGLRLDGMFLFALTPRGDRIAYRGAKGHVRVADTASAAQELAVAGPARLHNTMRVGLKERPFELIIGVGNVDHRFTVEAGRLRHHPARPVTLPPPGRPDERLVTLTGYDPARFVPTEAATRDRLVAVLDRLGQVLLTTRTGDIVAVFLVRRGRAAAWLPAGVFWGDPALIGGGPSPDAEERIGRAILEHTGAK
jgi:hypothetical protein